jgi:glutamyl-tRNA reductase
MTSPLVVGLSYRTAPMGLLEQAALGAGACRALEARLCGGETVVEAVVLSTCNRLEVYATVTRFHGGLAAVGEALAETSGISLAELTDHLYVHYEDAAVAHLFAVASGLDSMAIGEQEILGQVRSALREAQDGGTVSRGLVTLLQQALRVGKRAHAETGLDRAGAGLVEAALGQARRVVGPLEQAHAVVLGAGAMSGLAVATLARAGIGRLTVVNRSPERGERLAASAGGTAIALADVDRVLAEADIVLACTGAVGHLVDVPGAKAALAERDGRPQAYLDLALPRDIEPAVAGLDGATVIDLEALGHLLAGEPIGEEIALVRDLVAEEVEAYLSTLRVEQVAPTVVALRGMASRVVEAELTRLRSRIGADLDERLLAELEQTVHRVVEKLLHSPTVRVKELAAERNGSTYAEALRELFGLDLSRVAAVTTPGGTS